MADMDNNGSRDEQACTTKMQDDGKRILCDRKSSMLIGRSYSPRGFLQQF